MRHHLPIAVVAGLALAVSAAAGVAEAQPAPATPPTTTVHADRACTLSASLTHPSGESASCLAVGATLSSTPSVGQTATLTVTVQAARAERNTLVVIDLPRTFAFADGTATRPGHNGAGPIARSAPVTMSLAAGQSRSFTRTVKAIGGGFGEIDATATNRLDAARTDGGQDSIFVTTARAGVHSHLGATDEPAASGHATTRGTSAEIRPEHASTSRPVTPPLPARAIRPAAVHPNAAGTSCVTGTWQYKDKTGTARPGHNVIVKVFNSANVQLGSDVYTGGDGSFTACYPTGGATTTVHVTFNLSNPIWSVQDFNNNVYFFYSPTFSVADGGTYNLGFQTAGDSSLQRASHTYQLADDEYQWVYQYYSPSSGCWSPFETTCRQLAIHWTNDNTDKGTDWNQVRGVYLLPTSPDSNSEPLHEFGHNLMYELDNDTFPPTDCPVAGHHLFENDGVVCGWTEGWADWVSTSVLDSSVYTFAGGATADFNITWNQCGNGGCDTGDHVEARVVQAMRSLSDGVKAPFDNDAGEGNGNRDNRIWFNLLHDHQPNNFADVWNDRSLEGDDVGQTALSALYEGTIDYGFRNPLSDYSGKHLPQALPPHNYSYTTNTGYWSVVAAKPDFSTSDVDLSLFTDYAQSASGAVGTSEYGGSTTDFIAVNSNSGHRALQTYYPRVSEYSGSGGYSVQEAQGSNVLSTGTSTNYQYADQPVRVWDSYQTAGTPTYYRAVGAGGQDLQLASAPANNDIVTRNNTVQGTDPGYNTPATLVVNPGASGYAGLVLLNNGLTGGNVTVYADTSAPTGTGDVNQSFTYSRDVTLTISASDPQTGVAGMQISTDGTFDTEPVLPYSTSGTAHIDGPSGIHSVYTRFLNNAGMWSAPTMDLVNLYAPPAITSISPDTGRTSGGQSVIITGTDLSDVTAVRFGSTSASSYTVDSSTQITATTPAHALGAANVSVKTAHARSDAGTGSRFTFVAAPTISSVSPSSGPVAGGKTVTITGTGFIAVSKVSFGATAAASFTVVSSTRITAVTPAHAAGAVNVIVTASGGTSAAVAGDRYIFANAPTVSGVSPNSGTTAGGQTVTITGTGFTAVSAVKFGSTPAASFTVVSSTRITTTTPAHASGGTYVYVTTGAGTSPAVTADRYIYG